MSACDNMKLYRNPELLGHLDNMINKFNTDIKMNKKESIIIKGMCPKCMKEISQMSHMLRVAIEIFVEEIKKKYKVEMLEKTDDNIYYSKYNRYESWIEIRIKLY